MSEWRALWLAACLLAAPAVAVEIDGRIDPEEWAGARHVTDFRKVQPLNGEPASLPTEAWILATPDGLAVAFRNIQPPSVPRTQQRVQRDFEEQVDRVNVMVDFDGDHRTGYDFTISSTNGIFDAIITNESEFNKDWDGNWRHAVGGDDEALDGRGADPVAHRADARVDRRRAHDRHLCRSRHRRDRRARPPGRTRASSARAFSPTSRRSKCTQLQSVAARDDAVRFGPVRHRRRRQRAATPASTCSGNRTVRCSCTATVNPDFGQVESDDLVVNFDATEIFISDKRPFFTENQGLFEFTTPSDFSQLLYTRRVGGPADDGERLGRHHRSTQIQRQPRRDQVRRVCRG